MPKETVPDYTGFPITKLPPGRAAGADSLTNWAMRRAVGRSGDGASKVDRRWICKKCGTPNLVQVSRDTRFFENRRCRHCKKMNGKTFLLRLKSK